MVQHDAKTLAARWAATLVANQNTENPQHTYRPSSANKGQRTVSQDLEDSIEKVDLLHAKQSFLEQQQGRGLYHKGQELGRGGMGVVYRASQETLGREVALKQVLSTQQSEKFLAEALLTGYLAHPNIVPVYEVLVLPEGDLAMSMKYVRGTSWKEVLHPKKEEQWALAAQYDLDGQLGILLQVCNAVAFAHSRGIVHNDLKPENVMLGEFGEVLLMDWGIALDMRPLESVPAIERIFPHKSALRSPCGTPAYMPRELAGGDGESIGPWTDTYLLGAMLHELLTGKPPHRGENLMEVLFSAIEGRQPMLPEEIPSLLREICSKALSVEPAARYQTTESFQEALRGYLKNRESIKLSELAQERFQKAMRAQQGESTEHHVDGGLYRALAESSAGFRQALLLWEGNRDAQRGLQESLLATGTLALQNQDFALVDSIVAQLEKNSEESKRFLRSFAETKQRVSSEQRASQRIRKTIKLGGWVFVLCLLVFAVYVYSSRQKIAKGAAQLAEEKLLANQRLQDVERLADIKSLQEITEEADTLWPATPEKVAAMEGWMQRADALVARREGHAIALEAFRKKAGVLQADGRWVFADKTEQWKHDTLQELLIKLGEFQRETRAKVEARLQFARTVQAESIEKHKKDWEEAIADIGQDPRYKGLKLSPQLGLVPLGKDPQSGLWEFAHLQSGKAPTRRADGTLEINEDCGIVLVLLPGDTFWMGAFAKKGREGNVDALAKPIEGPSHPVTLSAFFLSKYEMSQAQWLRATGKNPSAWAAGQTYGDRLITTMNPVEQMFHEDAEQVMFQLGLVLPTEAQWEYAYRVGTTSVWPTGDNEKSLQGSVNMADMYAKTHEGPDVWPYQAWLDDGYLVHAPINSYLPNKFGLHNMAGNVREWCLDHYGSYTLSVAPETGERQAAVSAAHIFRGGSYRTHSNDSRSASRYGLFAPNYRDASLGLRPAMLVTSQ